MKRGYRTGIRHLQYAQQKHSYSRVLHVLYTGRIVAEKGFRDYLWCARQLIGRPIQFHCIGDGDKELVKKIEAHKT